jgi:hypothetical protein
MSLFLISRLQQRPPYNYEPVPVAEDTVRDVLEYLFNTRAWKSEPELLQRRVAQWRVRLYAHERPGVAPLTVGEPAPMQPTQPPETAVGATTGTAPDPLLTEDDPAWLQAALTLRVQHRASWPVIAERVQRPRSTVQRVVRQTLKARGYLDPVTGT